MTPRQKKAQKQLSDTVWKTAIELGQPEDTLNALVYKQVAERKGGNPSRYRRK